MGKLGKVEKLGLNTLTAAALVAAFSCTAQNSFASSGSDDLIQFPNPLEMNHSMLRMNEAWNAIKGAHSLRSIFEEARNTLSIAQSAKTAELETVKFQHFYNGLEVVGSMAMHQKSAFGSNVLNRVAELRIDTTPRLQESEAAGIAMSLLGKRQLSSKPTLKILPEAQGSGARLVYWVNINSDELDGAREVIIDANTGEVIANASKNIAIAPINAYSAKNMGIVISQDVTQGPSGPTVTGCTLTNMQTGQKTQISAQKCQSLKKSDLPANACQIILGEQPQLIKPQFCQPQVVNSSVQGSDASALRAFQNSQAVLTYYQTHHGRNSYDNRGSAPTNIVHAGIGFDNAFWSTDQNIMVYGDGDGQLFGDFTLALDVAGHEQTHGVVAYTAKLTGWGENGALNEAFADFFGKMIANDNDWAIGRKLYLNQATAKGVRDLANPGALTFCAAVGANGHCSQQRPFPSTIGQKMVQTGTYDATNDNGWVHINSTIQGHASYLVVQAIGPAKAEKLYYAAISHALTSRDDITTAAQSIKKLCASVLDAPSCQAVNKAYAQVGL